MTIAQLLAAAQRTLMQAQHLPRSEAGIEAQLLLRHALGGVSRAWMIIHEHQVPSATQTADFEALLQSRLRGEPIAYLLGQREFYGLPFEVTPDVLIPRPDTETLVEAALARIPPHGPCRVLDLGTGSGAIAISIAKHRPEAGVIAVDRAETALAVAQRNAARLQAANVRCLQSDWFSALHGMVFDVIVSNPPYIASDDPHLQQGDLRYEPAGALASGTDGLDDIRRIIAETLAHLAPAGWLLLEHGYDQAERVARLLEEAGFTAVGHAADLAGIPRVTFGNQP